MSFAAILKFLFFATSGGFAYRSFVDANHGTPSEKVAATIFFLISIVVLALNFFPNDEASKTEQQYWESVEKHGLYCKYLEKYPDGQFKEIALVECPNPQISSPDETSSKAEKHEPVSSVKNSFDVKKLTGFFTDILIKTGLTDILGIHTKSMLMIFSSIIFYIYIMIKTTSNNKAGLIFLDICFLYAGGLGFCFEGLDRYPNNQVEFFLYSLGIFINFGILILLLKLWQYFYDS